MAAIAGCVGSRDAAYEYPCRAMLRAQRDYGPHGFATCNATRATFGVASSASGQAADFPAQSLISGDRYLFAADVRLDNRDDLLRDLGPGSVPADAESDSSILFRAWIRWHQESLDRIVGDFAFAALDLVMRIWWR